MSTRCYLNRISKSYEANRTLEGFVERPSEFYIVTRHFVFALWRRGTECTKCSNVHLATRTAYTTEKKQMPILAEKVISSCDSSDLISFQVFRSNSLLATSLIRASLALFYKTHIQMASNPVEPEIVFQRALTDAVVCLNSLVQVKIK